MNLTRRELLTAFLGAPFAMTACRENTSSHFPEGEIVGQSVSLGHVLRENRSFEVPDDKWESKKIAIIGSGVSGLGCAYTLRHQCHLTVFEASGSLGGHANTVDVRLDHKNFGVDTGFLVYNERTYPHLIRLFEELHIEYAIMGGIAVGAHGIPRPTHDLDFKIRLERHRLPELYAAAEQLGYSVPDAFIAGWVDLVSEMPLVRMRQWVEGSKLREVKMQFESDQRES